MEFTKDLEGFFDETVGSVSMDDLTAKVESSILFILKSAHSDPRKHRFHKRAKSIQFPCPICGDSASDSSKMRGHIYLAYGLYKCYNNNDCSCSLDEFFRRFGIDDQFSPQEIQELQKVAANSRAEIYSTRQAVSYTDIDDVAPFLIDKADVIKIYDAVEIETDSYARNKISDRKIPAHKYPFLLWQQSEQCLLILNMHEGSNKVMNVVKRQMRPRFTGPKYITATYSELLAIKCGLRGTRASADDIDITPEVIAEKSGFPVEMIKKLDITCQYFNVLNVDWGAEIYVLEGPIDSFFLPNSLAFGGTGVDLKHPTFLYIYDDDEPGRKEAYKKLDNKQPVFAWKRFYRENQVYKMGKKPYVTKYDINDMWKIQPFNSDLIRQYFVDNPLFKLDV